MSDIVYKSDNPIDRVKVGDDCGQYDNKLKSHSDYLDPG